ncbi:GNAT family N-acetyltransferase [Kutzneria viridogrisea]|uniref:N-acetyltransferase domain-containing protein n=2 Tax=Kutzneria TaxID=43356 RepID=W5WA55_9PSEU|nr:GNAT family N-acetyltransferase [Kutzneria albida]AHH97426.1 hypothetical protein KALB_4062 [Kutzneria albida DSM 43870]MBA8930654.1 ribosomal protein S18 acetylase RimI-like enzyme [Kutzneria viridogrisea]
MNSAHFTAGVDEPAVVITRVAEMQWHAVADDRVVGRGEAFRRPDGRIFLSIDSWRDTVFDQLAEAMLAILPTPLHTVVDEADLDLTSSWRRVGFSTGRREWEYHLPTDPRVTGLDTVRPPSGVTVTPIGAARQGPLREVYDAIRAEVDVTAGWESMPTEVLVRSDGTAPLDPSKYAVAEQGGRYVGLVRVVSRRHHARIGLVAVRADDHRRGIARALLANVLGALHRGGVDTASAEVDESNEAAKALCAGLGARRMGSALELVRR